MPRRIVVSLGALLMFGCATETSSLLNDAGPLFLALKDRPSVNMDALYDGPITLDAAGCIRLGSQADRHTVVWPFGATLRQDGTDWVVQAGNGQELGRIGERFRFGGGEISSLHTQLVRSELAVQALARCPGKFWIVAD